MSPHLEDNTLNKLKEESWQPISSEGKLQRERWKKMDVAAHTCHPSTQEASLDHGLSSVSKRGEGSGMLRQYLDSQ